MPAKNSRNNEVETLEIFNIPDFIHIYKDGSVVEWQELEGYIKKILGNETKIDIRENYVFHHHGEDKNLKGIAEKFAKSKVFDMSNPTNTYNPFPVEIKHEKSLIIEPNKRIHGVMYDGIKLQNLLRELIPKSELSFAHLHIVFTNRLFGTWDRGDRRYHARVSIYGFPNLISTTGIVEAPAKPKKFYVLRKALMDSGMDKDLVTEELKNKFKDKFIDYDDKRIIDIVKGYALQAFFYHTTFEPFCMDKNCRLYNAHWQEEMIHAQLEEKDLCKRHEKILEKIKVIKK